MKTKSILWLMLLCISILNQAVLAQNKVRTIVTTDGEVDDMDSFVRMLLYTNELKLEGLVYSSSQWHWKGDGKGTKFTSELETTAKLYGERTDLRWVGTTWIQEFLDDYETVYPSRSTSKNPGCCQRPG